jgi:hypothetical protein
LFPFEGISISLKGGESLDVDAKVLSDSLTYGPSVSAALLSCLVFAQSDAAYVFYFNQQAN